MALRDYNAAVDFMDRNVAEGRGDKAVFIDPSRNLTYSELRGATAGIGAVLLRAAAYLKFCVIWRQAC